MREASAGSPSRSLAELIATAEAASVREADRRRGPGGHSVRGTTRRGCCVHLSVIRADGAEFRWRYELDGSIVDEPAATVPALQRER